MRALQILFLMLFHVLLVLCFSVCQDIPRESGARMEFDKDFHDFGEIEQNTVVSHVFNFENTGADTLIISKVGSS